MGHLVARRTILLGVASSLFMTNGGSGRVTAEDAAALIKAENATVERVMVRLLPIARHYARPPSSNFHVGAVGLGAGGALYLGANFEVGGNALNQTIHGEQSVVANAFSHQENGLAALAVTGAPCGHCRQFLNELTGGLKLQIIVPDRESLGVTAGMLNSPPEKLHLTSGAKDALAHDALVAAGPAYAPYTEGALGLCGPVQVGPLVQRFLSRERSIQPEPVAIAERAGPRCVRGRRRIHDRACRAGRVERGRHQSASRDRSRPRVACRQSIAGDTNGGGLTSFQ